MKLPPSIKLKRSFQPFVPGLLSDLAEFTPDQWVCHAMIPDDLYWRVIPLRSRGGDPKDWTPKGPDKRIPYADTPLMSRCPATRELLGTFQCELNSVRFSGVPAGGKINQHTDHDSSGLVPGSQLRLHIPIVTHPDAVLTIDGEPQQWAPGEMWWGDFTRLHKVENKSPVFRVHLLICAIANEWLLDLFPRT